MKGIPERQLHLIRFAHTIEMSNVHCDASSFEVSLCKWMLSFDSITSHLRWALTNAEDPLKPYFVCERKSIFEKLQCG